MVNQWGVIQRRDVCVNRFKFCQVVYKLFLVIQGQFDTLGLLMINNNNKQANRL